jgi:hypothetical protein
MAIQAPTVPTGVAPMPRGAPNVAPIPTSAATAYPGTTSAGGYLKTYGTEAGTDTLSGQTARLVPDAMPSVGGVAGTGKNPTYPTPPGDGTNIPVGFEAPFVGQQQYGPSGERATVGPVGAEPSTEPKQPGWEGDAPQAVNEAALGLTVPEVPDARPEEVPGYPGVLTDEDRAMIAAGGPDPKPIGDPPPEHPRPAKPEDDDDDDDSEDDAEHGDAAPHRSSRRNRRR